MYIMKGKRIEYLDIAKGIGIILVVWAHAEGPLSSQIYQFHMPFFFLISGLLYNERSPFTVFAIRRVKRLYIPFVFWNMLTIWAKRLYFGGGFLLFAKETVKVLFTLKKDGQFFGATWFLGALFLVSVVYKLVDSLLPPFKYRDAAILICSSLIAVCGFEITLPYMLSRTLILSMYFAMGVFAKNRRDVLVHYDSVYLAAFCAIAYLVISHYGSANMGANEYRYPLLFAIGAILASYAVLFLCRKLTRLNTSMFNALRKSLVFLGERSIDIVIWQFVFFRFIIILQMYLNEEALTIHNILSYYPLYDSSHGWWFIYLAIGIVVPILWCSFLRSGRLGKELKTIHAV